MAPGHTVPGATTRTLTITILKIKQFYECEGNNFCVNKSTPLMQQRAHKYIQKISHCRICACDIFVYNYLSYIPNIFSNKPPIFSPTNSQFSLKFSKLSPLSNVFLKIILYNKSRHPRLYRQLRPRFKSRLLQKVLHMRLHSTLRNIKFFCYLIISYARCK